MSSEKYIENITIQYLLKPNLQNQIIKNNSILSKDFKDDVKFYKKRISQYIKDICKDINSETFEISSNDKTKLACVNFIKNLIEDYKFNDKENYISNYNWLIRWNFSCTLSPILFKFCRFSYNTF